MTTTANPNFFRLAWASDTHLDMIIREPAIFKAFVNSVLHTHKATGLLITGDISSGAYLLEHLKALHRGLGVGFPIWFVCGNHDYYHASISSMRASLLQLGEEIPELCWLGGNDGFVPIAEKTALVGHDGWYDGLYAPIANSHLLMNDFFHISELKGLHALRVHFPVVHVENGPLHLKMQELAQEGALHVRKGAEAAVKAGNTLVLIATHVAPFPQNSLHRGKPSDKDWMPFFSSKIMGEAILDIVDANPEVQFRVLCGHNHCRAEFTAGRSNLVCLTAEADYGYPAVEKLLLL